jgi:hypothetical protein
MSEIFEYIELIIKSSPGVCTNNEILFMLILEFVKPLKVDQLLRYEISDAVFNRFRRYLIGKTYTFDDFIEYIKMRYDDQQTDYRIAGYNFDSEPKFISIY